MKFESTVTSISWIPADAVKGIRDLPFDIGSLDFDAQLPNELAQREELTETFSFRFENRLTAWIDVDDEGEIVEAGFSGGGLMGTPLERGSPHRALFQATLLPELQPPPEFGDGFVRFVQSVGMHGSIPVPRSLRRAPFVQWRVPLSWTTLALTIRTDGQATHELVGASRFPRHWVFNIDGKLVSRTGLVDVDDWYRTCFDEETPWGELESRAVTSRVESALVRTLSQHVMSGAARPKIVNVRADTTLARQGDAGSAVFLVLDGYVCLEADRKRLVEYGPGALIGERAALTGAKRSASLVSATKCRLAMIPAEALERDIWDHLASGRRREEPSAV
jgi:hypothetical protein